MSSATRVPLAGETITITGEADHVHILIENDAGGLERLVDRRLVERALFDVLGLEIERMWITWRERFPENRIMDHGSNPRQAGRPPLPPDQRRDHTLRVRCDDALADAVEEAARAERITVGAWIRRTLERALPRR